MGRITRKYKADVTHLGASGGSKTVEGEIQVPDSVPTFESDAYACRGVRAREGRGNNIVTRVEIDGKEIGWHC